MMFAWLMDTGPLKLARWIWLAILAALLLVVIAIADNAVEDGLDTAKATGQSEARADQAEATIKQVEKANAAADDVRRSDDARRADCLRDARNPADC